MNGGHYTALSKVEDVILTDVLRQRCGGNSGSAGASAGAGKGSSKGSGESVCHDDVDTFVDNSNTATKLSINEFISATATGTTNASNSNNSTSSTTGTTTSRWLKFDDEFVNVVPPANLHTSVVTGELFVNILFDACARAPSCFLLQAWCIHTTRCLCVCLSRSFSFSWLYHRIGGAAVLPAQANVQQKPHSVPVNSA